MSEPVKMSRQVALVKAAEKMREIARRTGEYPSLAKASISELIALLEEQERSGTLAEIMEYHRNREKN